MTNRPNVIVIQGEDAGRALGCYGDPDADTPNLDALAASGCRFDNAFSTAPVCAPSRFTSWTGQYAWAVGAHHMRSKLVEGPPVLTHALRAAGYYVNWQNKTDFNFDPPDSFTDESRPWVDDLRNGTLPDQPFFLYHNVGVTHESTSWCPQVYRGSGSNWRVAAEHLLDPARRTDPAAVRVPEYLPDTVDVRFDIARFYDAVKIADVQIGEMLDALEASPYRDNTIVIYLTDHGRGLWREKRWCFGAGIHLSLVVRAPGVTEPGQVNEELVSWVDLSPTILSLCGVGVPDEMVGRVFLGEEKEAERECVFAGRDRTGEVYDRVRAVRDRRYHYVRNFWPELPYAQGSTYMDELATSFVMRELHAQGRLTPEQSLSMAETRPTEELYDAVEDPDMVRNLADDPAHAETLARLRGYLDDHLATTQDLAEYSERELIERGIVKDMLDQFRARRTPLPERYRVGGLELSVLEMPERG